MMEIMCSEQVQRGKINLYSESSAQGGQTFISIQSGTLVLKTAHFDIPYLCLEKRKKKMEMFDKLLSRQKQKRDAGGRCR